MDSMLMETAEALPSTLRKRATQRKLGVIWKKRGGKNEAYASGNRISNWHVRVQAMRA